MATKGPGIDADLRQRLIQVARRKATVTYSGLSPAAPQSIGRKLDHIGSVDLAEGQPLLTAVAVTKKTGKSGTGFFALARAWGRFDGNNWDAFWGFRLLLGYGLSGSRCVKSKKQTEPFVALPRRRIDPQNSRYGWCSEGGNIKALAGLTWRWYKVRGQVIRVLWVALVIYRVAKGPEATGIGKWTLWMAIPQ